MRSILERPRGHARQLTRASIGKSYDHPVSDDLVETLEGVCDEARFHLLAVAETVDLTAVFETDPGCPGAPPRRRGRLLRGIFARPVARANRLRTSPAAAGMLPTGSAGISIGASSIQRNGIRGRPGNTRIRLHRAHIQNISFSANCISRGGPA